MVLGRSEGRGVNLQKYGITHLMRIPYATRYSRTQLHQAIERIAHDPIATELSKQCWKHPEQLHFLITRLRLDSAKSVKKACQLLRDVSAQYREVLCPDPDGKQVKLQRRIPVYLQISRQSDILRRIPSDQTYGSIYLHQSLCMAYSILAASACHQTIQKRQRDWFATSRRLVPS